ncbi:MAG TPA: acyltransferase [Isosphaeraceae bacterium]
MRRVAELDTIRGLAALSILVYHLRPEIPFGWTFVDLFLVLSGYLVTSIILTYHRSRRFLPIFAARRALRIWPVYFLTLFVLLAINPLLPAPFPMDGLVYYLTFTHNLPVYWTGTFPRFIHYLNHTWTLSVEEQFYWFWPALICLVGRRRVVPLAVVVVAAAVTARAVGVHPWLLAARCDGLALGGLLAALLADGDRVRRHAGALRLGFGLLTLAALAFLVGSLAGTTDREFQGPMTLRPALMVFVSNLGYFGLVGLLSCHAGHPALGFLRDRRLAYLGTTSYGIYLLHPIVFAVTVMVARALGVGPSWWLDVVKCVGSLALAALSWECVERRVLAWKDRFPYRLDSDAAPGRPALPATTVGLGRGDSTLDFGPTSSGRAGRRSRAGEAR